MPEPRSAPDAVPADARYRVLARKYRPSTLAELIGQEALVRTLQNALRSNRIAQAYMLAGVRGVGKTTTARIIARALNCVGPEGAGGITESPCGLCEHCVAIAEDRHLDVIEMDAASHTGVDNIRELLDGVPYRPAMARYKVYIIDEVHMLSEKAFNALLKTLEEPPEHVKFVFATTEIRKVPVTVLSRCQRFDLRRVEAATLIEHLARVAEREQVTVSPEALQLLARAADGSVRDSLSLLDQAIAHGQGVVDEAVVRDMLGLADRMITFDMFDALMRGEPQAALGLLGEQYRAGADPLTVLSDLLDLSHWLTRLKLTPEIAAAPDVPEAERVRGRQMADGLAMADVTRAWQILLKGLGETRMAPVPLHAAEMVLIRLAYAAQLPSPAEALEALVGGGGSGQRRGGGEGRLGAPPQPRPPARAETPAPSPQGQTPGRVQAEMPGDAGRAFPPVARTPPAEASSPLQVSLAAKPQTADGEAAPIASPRSFAEVAELAKVRNEGLLYGHLMTSVHLVRFEPRSIDVRLGASAPADLPQRLSRFLLEATGERWLVGVSHESGLPSLREQQQASEAARVAEAAGHPLVRAILDAFPGATIERIVGERINGGEPHAAPDPSDEQDEQDG